MYNSAQGSPIYDSLVAELGDVPTETRRTAEHIRLTVAATLGSAAQRPASHRAAPAGPDGRDAKSAAATAVAGENA